MGHNGLRKSAASRIGEPDMNAPGVGELAPAFELRDDTGQFRQLSARRGHYTVVYFYPEDDTSGCTTEACSFRDHYDGFVVDGAEIWGVSPQNAASKAAFRARYGLPFVLLADPGSVVAGLYGSVRGDGRTARNSFLVGPDGHILATWIGVEPEHHAEQVLEALRAARKLARATAKAHP
jgi:peroxiredoxin Q/BCP